MKSKGINNSSLIVKVIQSFYINSNSPYNINDLDILTDLVSKSLRIQKNSIKKSVEGVLIGLCHSQGLKRDSQGLKIDSCEIRMNNKENDLMVTEETVVC